ncbi:MAG: hypothetical protein ACYCRF_11200, partial [Acidithiobacillus sp.]
TLGSTTFVLTSTSITMTAGGKTVVVDSSGLTIDGIPFGTHAHTYNPGSGATTDTGGPVTP